MNLSEAQKALRFVDWGTLLEAEEGTTFPVTVNNEVVNATLVFSEDKADEDYDQNLTVVVKIGDQLWRKTGWGNVGSHCYGDYEPSWGSLAEVVATPKYVTIYEDL